MILPITWILTGLVTTPRNRGRLRRLLGSIGSRGSAEQEASAIAALVGGGSAEKALSEGAARFRSLPLPSLHANDLQDNKDTTDLFARTQPAKLGSCDAFVSTAGGMTAKRVCSSRRLGARRGPQRWDDGDDLYATALRRAMRRGAARDL